MALIPDEDIQKVIEANDLVQIASECVPDLKQKSGKFMACCPFHKEKTPSFQIDPDKQLWHCFGCGEGGNIVGFVEKIYDMNFPEAMEFLADKANIQLRKTGGKGISKGEKGRLQDACKEAADFYHAQLMKVKSAGSNSARKYLSSRGMGSDVAKRWTLGFAPGNNMLTKHMLDKKFSKKELLDANLCVEKNGRLGDRFFNRVMFPIRDAQGNVIAFGGRIMDDGQPKYLNSSENALFHKSQVMYGFDKAKANMTASGTAIVVEGYTDVIAMHEAGINYAVATLGTALTRQHIRLLNQNAKKKIVYLFDGDEAGQRAAERALNFIDQMERPEVYNKRAELVALTLPDNMDPKEFIDKNGADALLKLIDEAKPLVQYGIERKLAGYDLSVPGNKSRAATSALKVLAPIKDSLLAKEYCSMIADKTGMRTEDLIEELSKMKKPAEYSEAAEAGASASQATKAVPKSSKLADLEKELLSLIVKYPGETYKFIAEDFAHKWSSASHQKLFEFIMQTIASNNDIKSQELMMKIHQKNDKTLSKLTNDSKRYDFQNKPDKHVQYLKLLIKAEDISVEISNSKQLFKSNNSDELFKKIIELENALNEMRGKIREMI